MTALPLELRFDERFSGPRGAANGGFACGSLAALLGGAAEVTLRRPLPLARPLRVDRLAGGALELRDGGELLAEARPLAIAVELLAVPGSAAPLLAVPGAVSSAQARAAAGRCRYYDDPAFPNCFVCGQSRQPGDGLRIFPGRVAGRAVWAAPWTPDPSVAGEDGRARPEVVWAALDCPSGLAASEAAALPGDTAVLLGRMSARLAGSPRSGEECRVVGWPLKRDGRKLTAGSAVLGPDGQVLATARSIWITVPRHALPGVAGGGPPLGAAAMSGQGGRP